jgi:hypothetical protein
MRAYIRGFLALAGAALAAAGCSDSSTGATTGQLVVRVTDAPGAEIDAATAWISKVYLIAGADSVHGRIDVATFSPAQAFDLTTLRGGVTALLGSATIPVGDYSQIRLVVDSARVTLKAPLLFVGGSASVTLQTPSAMRTGIKVNLGGPVHVASGQTVLVVDFDVSRNFVLTGPLNAPTGMLFTPVLHGTTTDIAASIIGAVSPANAKAQLFAISSGGDTVATDFADTLSGAYMLRFLDPRLSPFTVAAKASGYATQTTTVPLVTGQTAAGVNFALTP